MITVPLATLFSSVPSFATNQRSLYGYSLAAALR
jgi:hypothetical protein